MSLSVLVYVHIPSHSNPGNKIPPHSLPATLFCVCYDLRPGILSKRKKNGWGSREFTCPLWLSCYPVAPTLGCRFPSQHPTGIIKLRTTGGGRSLSSLWKLEDGTRRLGSGWQLLLQVLPLLPQAQVCIPDLSPWPPRPSPTKRIRKLPVRRNWGLNWLDPGPGWDRLLWAASGLRTEAVVLQ